MIRCHQGIARVLVVTCFGGALLGSTVVASAANEAGKKLYQKNCESCHGADGNAPPAMAKSMQIPPVTGAVLKQKDDAAMLRIIAEGSGKMPGYAKKMSPAEQQQVLQVTLVAPAVFQHTALENHLALWHTCSMPSIMPWRTPRPAQRWSFR